MNDFLRLLALNAGKAAGALAGFFLGLFLISFGLFKTLFIIALVILGFILGKWHDEGISIKKVAADLVNALRIRKWR